MWAEEWARAHEASPLKVTPENESKWENYWSVCAPQYAAEVEADAGLYQAIIDHLVQEGRLRQDDDVMDVGCGPGTYTIPLARKCHKVVGLDSAPGMVEETVRRARQSGLHNVTGKIGRFDDVLPNNYDLVLTALSPAVRDAEALVRMGISTRRDCCYITAALGEEMKNRNELWEKVVGKFLPSWAYDIKFPLNVLLENGERPDLKFVSAMSDTVCEPNVAITNFQCYFGIFTEMNEGKRRIVEEYVLDRCEDGKFRKKARKSLAVMTWSPMRK